MIVKIFHHPTDIGQILNLINKNIGLRSIGDTRLSQITPNRVIILFLKDFAVKRVFQIKNSLVVRFDQVIQVVDGRGFAHPAHTGQNQDFPGFEFSLKSRIYLPLVNHISMLSSYIYPGYLSSVN